MAKRFNRGPGFKGGRAISKCNSGGKKGKKSGRFEHEDAPINSLSTPDDMYEKHLNVASSDDDNDDSEEVEEEVEEEDTEIYREPSVYDNLLKKLETSTKGHQGRKRKDQDENDSEEERDYESKSGEDDDLEDNDNSGGHGMIVDATRLSDDEASDVTLEEDDISDTEVGIRDDFGHNVAGTSQRQSKFAIHIAYKLSKPDVENLLKRKWKYRWEMPASDLTNGKWLGTGDCFLKDVDAAATAPPYGLKLKLYKHWLEIYNNTIGSNNFQSSKQRHFFSLCNSYRDILHHNKKAFYHKGCDEDSTVMDAYIMHLLNHVFQTRDLVTKNDAKLVKHPENGREEVVTSDTYLDQGFTRPKVLILLPLASIALRVVRRLIQLTPSANKANVEYMDRFQNEFGVDANEEDELEAGESKLQKPSKPSDYQALFGANNNDHFMVGIKFTRKCIRLYSDFYTSDMIVASPLGLITKIGEAEANKEKDVDYLS